MVEPKKSLMTQLLRLQAIRGGERELDSLLDVQKSANAAAKVLGVDNVIFDRPNAATRAKGTPPDLKNFFLRSPEGREDWLCLGYWDGHTNPLFSYPITQSWCSAEKMNAVIGEWAGVLDSDKPKSAAVAVGAARKVGRLNKHKSEAKKAELLAKCSAHPTLMNDFPALAESAGVSPATCRRWLAKFKEKHAENSKE